MFDYKLDAEEQEILDAFESGKMQSIQNVNEEIELHKKYAAMAFKKNKRISIRLAGRGLSMLQKLALLEGIPYQTFIASILHKYADGRYLETKPDNSVK